MHAAVDIHALQIFLRNAINSVSNILPRFFSLYGFDTAIYFLYLTNYLTNYMEQSPFWETNRFSASQETVRILWNQKVHYRIHKSPPHLSLLIIFAATIHIGRSFIHPQPEDAPWRGDRDSRVTDCLSLLFHKYISVDSSPARNFPRSVCGYVRCVMSSEVLLVRYIPLVFQH